MFQYLDVMQVGAKSPTSAKKKMRRKWLIIKGGIEFNPSHDPSGSKRDMMSGQFLAKAMRDGCSLPA